MGAIIIVMPRYENALRIRDSIKSEGLWDDFVISDSGREVLELSDNQDISLVITTQRQKDMGYEELVTYLNPRIPVILLTKDEGLLPFSDSVRKLIMPFKLENLNSLIASLVVNERHIKKKKLRSPEEQATIDKAKSILMSSRGMTEPEAFRYIQKTSMDTQRSFVETAEMILTLFN